MVKCKKQYGMSVKWGDFLDLWLLSKHESNLTISYKLIFFFI